MQLTRITSLYLPVIHVHYILDMSSRPYIHKLQICRVKIITIYLQQSSPSLHHTVRYRKHVQLIFGRHFYLLFACLSDCLCLFKSVYRSSLIFAPQARMRDSDLKQITNINVIILLNK